MSLEVRLECFEVRHRRLKYTNIIFQHFMSFTVTHTHTHTQKKEEKKRSGF